MTFQVRSCPSITSPASGAERTEEEAARGVHRRSSQGCCSRRFSDDALSSLWNRGQSAGCVVSRRGARAVEVATRFHVERTTSVLEAETRASGEPSRVSRSLRVTARTWLGLRPPVPAAGGGAGRVIRSKNVRGLET